MQKLFFVLMIELISTSVSQNTDVRELCTNFLLNPPDPCTAAQCQGRPGKVGDRGMQGIDGPKGQKGDRGPENQALRSMVVDLEEKDRENKREIAQMNTRLNELEDLITWYQASNGYFYKVFDDIVNFADAKERCRQKGGRLASTGIRNTEIRGELVRLMKTKNVDVWIGVNNIDNRNNFVWEDGVTSNVIDWATNGQPDHDGFCMHYRPSYGWKVNDEPCQREKKYMCEKEN